MEWLIYGMNLSSRWDTVMRMKSLSQGKLLLIIISDLFQFGLRQVVHKIQILNKC